MSRDSRSIAANVLLWLLYRGSVLFDKPASSMIPAKTDRNHELVKRYLAGERAVDLAEEFGISVRRANRLIRRTLDRGEV